jgi:hypothetical protein
MATVKKDDLGLLVGLIINFHEGRAPERDTQALLSMCGFDAEESYKTCCSVLEWIESKRKVEGIDDASPQDASFNHPGCGDVGDLSIDAHACDGCEFFIDEIEIDSTSGMSFHRRRCIARVDGPCRLETGEDIDGLPF